MHELICRLFKISAVDMHYLLTPPYDIISSLWDNTWLHYSDVIMGAMTSQITSLTIVYSTVYSMRRSKKTSKLRVTGLCARNSPVTGEFPAQMASNAENVSIWWRHHQNELWFFYAAVLRHTRKFQMKKCLINGYNRVVGLTYRNKIHITPDSKYSQYDGHWCPGAYLSAKISTYHVELRLKSFIDGAVRQQK